MQNSPSGVFLKDEEGRYVFMNRAGERLVGRTDWLGKTDDELMPPTRGRARSASHDRAVLERERAAALRPQAADASGRAHAEQRQVSAAATPPAGATSVRITSDVTEQRAAEDALREADRRKDQFIATLAHELRNPLAPIRTAVAILGREGAAEPDRAWSRDVIERQVAHLARLVDDLLDVARVTSGKLLLRRERVTLGRVVAAALETSRPALDAAGHRLVTHMPAAQAVLDADPTRLAQVLSNLLNNAAKYTPRRAARSSCAPSRRVARS